MTLPDDVRERTTVLIRCVQVTATWAGLVDDDSVVESVCALAADLEVLLRTIDEQQAEIDRQAKEIATLEERVRDAEAAMSTAQHEAMRFLVEAQRLQEELDTVSYCWPVVCPEDVTYDDLGDATEFSDLYEIEAVRPVVERPTLYVLSLGDLTTHYYAFADEADALAAQAALRETIVDEDCDE